MRIVITGATGFIGKALCENLHRDYEVIALSRNTAKAKNLLGKTAEPVCWDGRKLDEWSAFVDGALGVINLAGENIASGRWSKAKKERILNSRLTASQAILSAIKEAKKKPEVFIQASAVGYYGDRCDEILDENSAYGQGFLARVCRQIEGLAEEIRDMGIRWIIIRTGVVLGAGGGVLKKLLPSFKFFLGGCYGQTKAWLPWISLMDEVLAIRFLLENKKTNGVYNLTSPAPILSGTFYDVLGQVTARPVWFNPPGFLLKLLMGEMGGELLLSSQRVMPKRLLDAGFEFEYVDITKALCDILGERRQDGIR